MRDEGEQQPKSSEGQQQPAGANRKEGHERFHILLKLLLLLFVDRLTFVRFGSALGPAFRTVDGVRLIDSSPPGHAVRCALDRRREAAASRPGAELEESGEGGWK